MTNDTANSSKPLLVIERDLREKRFVTIFGASYYIKHREELGLGDLTKLDGILAQYAHLMSMAGGGKLDQMTDEAADSLEAPIRSICKMFLDGVPPALIDELTALACVQLMFAFNEALGTKPETPMLPRNRATRRQSNGAKSFPPSSASTAATRPPGRSRAGSASA